ncbi:MAG: hypothetical protein AAB261_01620 [Chloroflexota bacterium]|mgnify:FL=1
MTLQVTLSVSNRVVENAQRIAQQTKQPLEKILSEWLDHVAEELPVESLSDKEISTICEARLPETEQTELSALLADNREGKLETIRRVRLDHLMQKHDDLLLRKSHALREAVKRGLREPLAA